MDGARRTSGESSERRYCSIYDDNNNSQFDHEMPTLSLGIGDQRITRDGESSERRHCSIYDDNNNSQFDSEMPTLSLGIGDRRRTSVEYSERTYHSINDVVNNNSQIDPAMPTLSLGIGDGRRTSVQPSERTYQSINDVNSNNNSQIDPEMPSLALGMRYQRRTSVESGRRVHPRITNVSNHSQYDPELPELSLGMGDHMRTSGESSERTFYHVVGNSNNSQIDHEMPTLSLGMSDQMRSNNAESSSRRTYDSTSNDNTNSQTGPEMPALSSGTRDESFMSMFVQSSPVQGTSDAYYLDLPPCEWNTNCSMDDLDSDSEWLIDEQSYNDSFNRNRSSLEGFPTSHNASVNNGRNNLMQRTSSSETRVNEEFPAANGFMNYHPPRFESGINHSMMNVASSSSASTSAGNATIRAENATLAETQRTESGGRMIDVTLFDLAGLSNSTVAQEHGASSSSSSAHHHGYPFSLEYYIPQHVSIYDQLIVGRNIASLSPIADPQLQAAIDTQMRLTSFLVDLNDYLSGIQGANLFHLGDEVPAHDDFGDALEAEIADVFFGEGNDEWIDGVPVFPEEPMNEVQGLNEQQIDAALRTKPFDPKTATTSQCCICWVNYENGQKLGVLDCDYEHNFDLDCIKDWLLRNNSCPLCRMTGVKIL